MSGNDKPPREKKRKTLIQGSSPIIKPPNSGATSSAEPGAMATFPPDRWNRKSDLVSSAELPTLPPTESTAGAVTLSGDRLPETLARAIINRRFEQSGYSMQADFHFSHGDTLVTLDGFDPNTRVGYQYISHADEDVVTDHDAATSLALKQIAADGHAQILVIHDGEAPTGDALIALVDDFLAGR